MKVLLNTCILLALPMLASAASHDLMTFVEEYDLNHDGAVSKEEFEQERDRRFAVTDADHDGGLTREEYSNEYRARLAQKKPDPEKMERQMKQTDVRFNALDSNKDGKISPAEFAYSGWAMFTRHDYTKDGTVSVKDKVDG
jgi:Ca2+-binding EF-hand superfamily protein